MKIIAIDGPCAVGKGTISKIIAKKLNYLYIDTGAMYRCVALYAIQNNIDIKDDDKMAKILNQIDIDLQNEKCYLNNQDVSDKIRSKEVTDIVSFISNNIKLREHMVELQRKMAKRRNVIMEGRDITTVVFPNADFKFYLDAKEKERVKRRYNEYKEKNVDITLKEVKDNISKRDYNDKNKPVGALTRTDEQIYIDTSDLSIEKVVDKILEVVR